MQCKDELMQVLLDGKPMRRDSGICAKWRVGTRASWMCDDVCDASTQQPAAASAIHCNKSGDVVEQGREISGSISGRNKKEMFRWDRVIAARQLSWMGDIEWASLA